MSQLNLNEPAGESSFGRCMKTDGLPLREYVASDNARLGLHLLDEQDGHGRGAPWRNKLAPYLSIRIYQLNTQRVGIGLRDAAHSVDLGRLDASVKVVMAEEISPRGGQASPRRARIDKHLKDMGTARLGVDEVDENRRAVPETGVR